jgi:hypothetical protein
VSEWVSKYFSESVSKLVRAKNDEALIRKYVRQLVPTICI